MAHSIHVHCFNWSQKRMCFLCLEFGTVLLLVFSLFGVWRIYVICVILNVHRSTVPSRPESVQPTKKQQHRPRIPETREKTNTRAEQSALMWWIPCMRTCVCMCVCFFLPLIWNERTKKQPLEVFCVSLAIARMASCTHVRCVPHVKGLNRKTTIAYSKARFYLFIRCK